MSYVGQITIGSTTSPVGSMLYGTCDTAAATVAKVVTCSNFDKLLTGVTIHVKFTNSNTAASPTLNVNSTGAKNIYKYGTTVPGTSANTSWVAGSVVSFTYDGSAWQMNDHIDDTTYSAMSSSELTTGTATTSRVMRADYLKTGINSLIDTKIGALDVTGASSIGAGKTISAWSETDGKVSVSTQDISITKSQVSDFPTSMTPTSHTHGNITNGGALQTNDITIASGDKLVVTDSSNSSKIARTSVSFDGSTTTQCLTKKGTWATFGTSNLALGTSSTTALKGDTKYAGSSSAGGAATSAAKLTNTSKIGDTNKPVYFTANGVPAAISYTIGSMASKTCTDISSDVAFNLKNKNTEYTVISEWNPPANGVMFLFVKQSWSNSGRPSYIRVEKYLDAGQNGTKWLPIAVADQQTDAVGLINVSLPVLDYVATTDKYRVICKQSQFDNLTGTNTISLRGFVLS